MFFLFLHSMEAKRLTPKDAFRDSVLLRIYNYRSLYLDSASYPRSSYAYTKFQMRTNRRNFTLALIPSMYAISKGTGRHFIGEYYSKMTYDGKTLSNHRMLNVSTIPHRRNTMPSVLNFLAPNVYGECLFQDNILSPFHRTNKKYYTYSITVLPFGKAQVYIYPRLKNTQLVTGKAIVDYRTGRICMVDFEGEYDMTRFFITITMAQGIPSATVYPKQCDLRANFRFMGNQITAKYSTTYGLQKILEDSLDNVPDTAMLAMVRPIPLNEVEKQYFESYYINQMTKDSLMSNRPVKKSFVKDVLWDIIGDNVLNRIKQNFGKQTKVTFESTLY